MKTKKIYYQLIQKKKLFSNLKSNFQKNNWLKKLASDINSNAKDLFVSHRFSNINLDSLRINVQGQFIRIKFSDFNNKLESQIHLDSIIYACDNSLISRDGYRQLAAVQPSLEREWHFAARKKEINLIMENKIPIKNFNINSTNEFPTIQKENNSNIHLDENIKEIIINKDQMGNGSIRSLVGLLITLIPDLTEGNNPVLHNNNIIKIKLGGDG